MTDDKEQVQTEMVYKVDNQYLQHYIQYNYTYDDEGRVICKEALKWNDIRQAYERYYCLNFEYDADTVNMEYARWNEESNSYTAQEKAVYTIDGLDINYQSYLWDEQRDDWNLNISHSMKNDVMLLAEK